MTATTLLAAFLLFEAAPSPPSARSLQQQLEEAKARWQEEQRVQWEKRRREAKAAYETAKAESKNLERQVSEGAIKGLDAQARRQKAHDVLVGAWLDTFVHSSSEDRLGLRKEASVVFVPDAAWREVLNELEIRVKKGEVQPREMLRLLDATRQKLALAGELSRPEYRKVLAAVLEDIKKSNPKLNLRAIGDYDSAAIFDLLRELNGAALLKVAERAESQIATYDPSSPLVTHPIAVVFLLDQGVAGEDVEGFIEAFGAWMKAASPDGQSREKRYTGWRREQIDSLMEAARQLLGATIPAESMPECPPEPYADATAELNAVLCPPKPAGVIAIHLSRQSDEKLMASVFWRIRQDYGHIGEGNQFPEGGFRLSGSTSRAAGASDGDELAMQVLKQGTAFKRVARILAILKRIDAARLERVLGTSVPADSPVPSTPPVASHEEPAQPAANAEGKGWHAALFAGLPYLEDKSSSTAARLTFSALDTVALAGTLTSLSLSIVKRNQFSTGNESALGDANSYLTASAWFVGSLVAVRLAATGCYYMRWCRRWTSH